jgi:alpha-beta hydrolase superfamily lysophospholipase
MTPLWFGPEDHPLFGWLHLPEIHQVRGGVLLCPTLGLEAVSARYAYKQLAERLAQSGFAAFRFDYEGTGDSAGREDDPGRVAAWSDSIRIAEDRLRSIGIGRFSVVGMRMGATLAADVFGERSDIIDDLVLWDPCASGRAFLREQGALWSFALDAGTLQDGSIETLGLRYDRQTVEDLSPVAIAGGDGPLAERVLLLMRAGRKGDRRMNDRLDMSHVRRVPVTGQEELVDVKPDAAIVPGQTIETIVEWLVEGAADSPLVTVDPGAVTREQAVVGRTVEGLSVVERLCSLGPSGLFGIMTSTAAGEVSGDLAPAQGDSGERRHRPTIILLNAGLIDHVGPGRWWVSLSRSWAEAGFRVLRFDLSGIGDSPMGPGQHGAISYPPDAIDDVLQVLQDVSPNDPSNVVLVGLCSGGYHAVEGAIAARVRGLCAVNPILTIKPAEVRAGAAAGPESGKLDARRQASGATKGWARALPAHDFLGSFVQTLPSPVWWLINRIAVDSPPARSLAKLMEVGANTFIIAGEKEARAITRGDGRTMRHLRRTAGFRMEIMPGLEHSLLERRGRERATTLLVQHVIDQFGA